MSSIDDSIGHVYSNSGNGSGKENLRREADKTKQVGNGKCKNKTKDNEVSEAQSTGKIKRRCIAYKYSSRGKGVLREAVTISGLPVFLEYGNGKLKIVENIEEQGRIIKPPNSEEYPYEPYEFANMNQVMEYVDRAKSMSIDSLYTQVKRFVTEYNDQDQSKLTLVALDIIFSYF